MKQSTSYQQECVHEYTLIPGSLSGSRNRFHKMIMDGISGVSEQLFGMLTASLIIF